MNNDSLSRFQSIGKKTFELTAAGTVPEFNGIPFYYFLRKIIPLLLQRYNKELKSQNEDLLNILVFDFIMFIAIFKNNIIAQGYNENRPL